MQTLFPDLPAELDVTRTFIDVFPEEHAAWRPHEKSFSLGELARHLVNLFFWHRTIVAESGFDLSSSPPPEKAPGPVTREALLAKLDAEQRAFQDAFDGLTDDDFDAPWTLRNGDEVVFTEARARVLRRYGVSHMIHHRGQMALYYRMLGLDVPKTY